MKELYDAIANKITVVHLRDEKLSYWHEMEKAFYLFCNADYSDALLIYSNVKMKFKEKYCLHFRIGEIYMKLGEIQKALTEFDESEVLISACKLPYKNKNLYDIKVMLALVYWMLGDEYIDIALSEIEEAEKIYADNYDELKDKICNDALINNVCWYHLSKFIVTQNDTDYNNVLKKFEILEKLVEDDKEKANLSCNALDTLAWFYYNKFLFKRDPEDANKAIDCCIKMKDRFNYTSFNFSSIHVQFNHIKDIMSLKKY
jgi:tetratricopeptide (TPR) repeat protein